MILTNSSPATFNTFLKSFRLTQAGTRTVAQWLMLTAALLCCPLLAAAQPGDAYPAASSLSDQRLGSALIYNFYTSSAANPSQENTRLNLTNHGASNAVVHLFFIDGASGTVADVYQCLVARQTLTLNSSDFDPGIAGYAIAVAVSVDGCPINYNFLSGSAWIKRATGHQAGLPAEAVAAIAADPSGGCTATSTSATLLFDGTNYNRLPHSLAAEKIRSTADGNSMQIILNRLGGNLSSTISSIGSLTGTLYHPTGTAFPFTDTGSHQAIRSFGVSFPRVAGGFSSVIVSGQIGWMRLGNDPGVTITGAILNFNPNASTNAAAFNGGHNLRHLALSSSASLTIPVRASNCRF